ncbi:MAG: alanine racemase [Syntrophaceticus sp.]|nr:alanine racemase [Syntrophaceticus sp.]MDD4782317.1 alanine racemase [Syntrophaceticus sp.]
MADIGADCPCWVDVNLDAVGNNTAEVKKCLENDVRLMAVVKSDAYGHGMLSAARTVLARGADTLGVTHPDEGVALREGGIDVPILIFRPLLPGEEDDMVRYGLTSSISSLDQAERLSAAAQRYEQKAVAHIKVETGMGRTGFISETLMDVADSLFSLPGLEWEGIYTHFASAASDPSFTRHQFHIFNDVVQGLAEVGVEFPLRHVCNSAAALLYPEMHLEMVRVGTLLYGQFPAGVRDERFDLQDTWSFWTRIIHLQEVRQGKTIGYGRTQRLRRDTVVAVLPVGYSDGFGVDVQPRPSGLLDLGKVIVKTILGYLGYPVGWFYVTVNGTSVPVIGRVGMELTCIDVGKIPDIKVGDPVLLNARRTVLRESIPYAYKLSDKRHLHDMS